MSSRNIIKVLSGHINEETAYVINDYPYGFRLRTKIRYWLETKEKNGDRFCSQTLNPETGKWNKPKKSTYIDIGYMFLDKNNHVKWDGLSFNHNTLKEIEDLEQLAGKRFTDIQKKRFKTGKILVKTREILKVK